MLALWTGSAVNWVRWSSCQKLKIMPAVALPQGSVYYSQQKAETTQPPPLMLVHGAGGSHLDWPPELRRLPGVRVIALDLPGHGRSAGPGRSDTLAYAETVGALLDSLKIERAVIAGHSMGGAVAQQMALHRPDRVAGLILMGTGSKLPIDPTLPQRIVEAPEKTVDWIVDWSWDVYAPQSFKMLSRQRLLEVPPQVLQGDYLACQAFDVRDQLDRIAVPTLVICAAEDRMVKPQFGMTLAEHIPNCQLVMIEQAGHMFPVEKASLVAQAVLAWFAEQGWSAPCAG